MRFFYPTDYDPSFPTAHKPQEGTGLKDIACLRTTAESLKYVKNWLDSKAKGRKVIVVTLRSYNYMPARNSNLKEWATFLKKLDPLLYYPVIVPDTACAMEEVQELFCNYSHFNLASWNIEFRAALYELAYLNMGVNNGPLALCWLNSRCRYLMFKILTPSVPQTTRENLESMGFKYGQNPSFASSHQKWVWAEDSSETLFLEFEKMCDIIEGTKLRNKCTGSHAVVLV